MYIILIPRFETFAAIVAIAVTTAHEASDVFYYLNYLNHARCITI